MLVGLPKTLNPIASLLERVLGWLSFERITPQQERLLGLF
jgi:hypothetical protein